jgi:hypothetical protein
MTASFFIQAGPCAFKTRKSSPNQKELQSIGLSPISKLEKSLDNGNHCKSGLLV